VAPALHPRRAEALDDGGQAVGRPLVAVDHPGVVGEEVEQLVELAPVVVGAVGGDEAPDGSRFRGRQRRR
jgi:hypothetical protein